jgi:hypothetical protein
VAVLETHIRHASDWIAWIDRSGYAAAGHLPRVDGDLRVSLDEPVPRDLCLYQKPGVTVLWRSYTDAAADKPGLTAVVDGAASEADVTRPVETGYAVSGRIADPKRRFNPRRFAVAAGNTVGHALALYRSPLGTRFSAAGGLHGCLRWGDGRAAAWAVVEVTVAPPVGPALPFAAQADAAGEFELPLSRLPALTRDAPSESYPATLAVRALAATRGEDIPDPDTFVSVNLLAPADGAPTASAAIAVRPGHIDPVTSQGEDHLVLQEP